MAGVAPGSLAALLQSALAHHQEGRLDEAERLYRQVLEHEPRNRDALRLLGVVKRQDGDLEAARELLELALQSAPGIPDTHHDLGLVWFELHRYRDAIAAYRRALEIQRDFPEAYYNLGNAYYALGDIGKAEESYLEARRQQPEMAEVHFNLGLLEQDRGDDSAAVAHNESALRVRPNYPEATLNLGRSQSNLGQLSAAEASFRRALALRADYLEAWLSLGDVLQRNGAMAEAESCFRHALDLCPSNVPARLNLAMALNALARLDDAVAEAQTAVDLAPENARAHAYLGGLLLKKNECEKAITFSKRALALDPNFIPARVTLSQALLIRNELTEAAREAETILNSDATNVSAQTCLGVVRSRQRRPWEALCALEKAVDLNPSDSDAVVHLAICELLLGRYIPGWKHYEARWATQLTSCVPRHASKPRWQGENLAGRTLLLYGEQGFGDTIQFCRYTTLTARCGGRVIVECQPALKAVLKTLAGPDAVIGYGETLPHFDLHAPLLSLPHIFQTAVESIPAPVPYLSAPSGVFVKLPEARGARLKVGFAWCGSQSQNHDPRPMPFQCLQTIFDLEGIGFYSFQTGAVADEVRQAAAGLRLFDLNPCLTDFSATACLVNQLDLVISIDTALAHLAGAMGKSVWVLLPFAPDWRWGLEGELCPWYPTMRLFRQSESGNWSEVMDRVVHQLQLMLQKQT